MTQNTATEQLLESFASILTNDPGALDPTSAYYVPGLHGQKANDVVRLLERNLRRKEQSALVYFSGQRGTGKSTELKRLTTLLNGDASMRAFMIDALEFINDSHPLELIDLMLVMALAFAERLHDEYGTDFLHDSIAKRIGSWLQTEVEVTDFTFGGIKFDFRSQQQTVIARLREFDISRRERFIQECREYMSGLARFVQERHKVGRVVLIVDSLERLRGVGTAATDMFDRVVKVFDGGMDTLNLPQLHVVYSVPPYLTFLSNVRARVHVSILVSIKVCKAPASGRRLTNTEGLYAMQRIVEKRFPEWQRVIQQAALDKLSFHSGGDVRQLLRRLLVDVIDEAYFAQERLPLSVDDPIIASVIEKHQIEFEQMVTRDEYPLLKTISVCNKIDLPKRADLTTAARFFDIRAVLNYQDNIPWVDVNPLLWPSIDSWQVIESQDPHEPIST